MTINFRFLVCFLTCLLVANRSTGTDIFTRLRERPCAVLGTCGIQIPPVTCSSDADCTAKANAKIAAIELQRAKETADFNTYVSLTNQFRVDVAKTVVDMRAASEIAGTFQAQCRASLAVEMAGTCLNLLEEERFLLDDANNVIQEIGRLGGPSSAIKLGDNVAGQPLSEQATIKNLAVQISTQQKSAIAQVISPSVSGGYCTKLLSSAQDAVSKRAAVLQDVKDNSNLLPLDVADNRVVALIDLIDVLGGRCSMPPEQIKSLSDLHHDYIVAGASSAGVTAPARVSAAQKRCQQIPRGKRDIEYLNCSFTEATPALVARLAQ